MAKQTWTLTDVDRDIYLDHAVFSPANIPGTAAGWSVTKRTLRGGLRDGVDVVEVTAGPLQFVVVPTRGMGLWDAWWGDLRLGWNSPVKGPVHPGLVRLWEPSGIGWLDGFDELLVRCGLESNGAPEFNANGTLRYPLHGKIANQPARKVEVAVEDGTADERGGPATRIAVTGVVDEARLFGNKLRMTSTIAAEVGQPVITVTDAITNLSAESSDLELLYHINFGAPLLEPGSKVVLPVARMAPRDQVAVGNVGEWDTYGPQSPGTPEAVFFFDLAADADGDTLAVLHNASASWGVSLSFNKTSLPCFTLWKNRQAAADGYVTGLEPGINFPNRKSFEKEKGRVAVLAPGETRTFGVSMTVLPDTAGVAAAVSAVERLLRNTPPQRRSLPDPEWSA